MTAKIWRSSIQLQDYKQNKLPRTAERKPAGREIHGGNPGVGRQETHPKADEEPGTSGEASLHFPDSSVPQRRGAPAETAGKVPRERGGICLYFQLILMEDF